MIEWIVWLADGDGTKVTTMDSAHHKWEDVPDRVLVIRWWDHDKKQKGIHWGDSNYGLPGTWKGGEIIDDEVFADVYFAAQAATTPPSQQGD